MTKADEIKQQALANIQSSDIDTKLDDAPVKENKDIVVLNINDLTVENIIDELTSNSLFGNDTIDTYKKALWSKFDGIINDIVLKNEHNEIIETANYGFLFEYFDFKNDKLLEDKILTRIAKLTGNTKTGYNQLLKEHRNNKNKVIKEKIKAREQQKFKSAFELDEDIIMPYGYSIKGNFLYFSSEKVEIAICKLFNVQTKILTEDRAHFEIKKLGSYGNAHTMVASGRDLIENKRVATLFADTGEIFDTQKAGYVTKFISEYIRLNEFKITEKIGREKTGWTKGKFYLPQLTSKDDNCCVWLDDQKELKKRFITKGSVEEQKRMIKLLSKGKIFLLTLAGLSSSLYTLIDELKLNYTVHIGGLNGEGKSLAIKSAISLYGTPDEHLYGRSWNNTLNGIETYLETMKDVPAWIDDLESAPKLKDVITTLYMYSNVAGKGRAFVQDGEVKGRTIKHFRGILFSTGEKGIDEIISKISSEGENKPLGLTRRVLDLNISELWENVDPKVIGRILDKNHGFFANEWIDILNIEKDNIQAMYDSIDKTFNWDLQGKEKLLYIMYLVLDLLKKYKLIDEVDYNAQAIGLQELYKQELKERERVKDIGGAFLEVFNGFVGQNINKFMRDVKRLDQDNNEFISTEQVESGEILGKIGMDKVYIINNVFTKFCKDNGYVKKQVIESLSRNKNIEISPKYGASIPVAFMKSSTTRVIILDKKALEDANNSDNLEDCPF